MVCVAAPGVVHNFDKDPLTLALEGDRLSQRAAGRQQVLMTALAWRLPWLSQTMKPRPIRKSKFFFDSRRRRGFQRGRGSRY